MGDETTVFQVYTSADGTEWTYRDGDDSDNYWHLARKVRERSRSSGVHEQIVRADLARVIITFYRGMAEPSPGQSV